MNRHFSYARRHPVEYAVWLACLVFAVVAHIFQKSPRGG